MLNEKGYLEIFAKISGLKSLKDKIALLKETLQDDTFRRVVQLTLDPYTTYGVRDYVIYPNAVDEPPADLFDVLKQLSTRTLSGTKAKEKLGLYANQSESAEQLLCLILGKDLQCGVGIKTANSAYPGLLREFQVSAAQIYSQKHAVFPLMESLKLDGVRCFLICRRNQDIIALSRAGHPLSVSNDIIQQACKLYKRIKQDFVLDGELKSGVFKDTMSVIRTKGSNSPQLRYYVFDYIPYDTFLIQGTTLTQIERYSLLYDILKGFTYSSIVLLKHYFVYSHEEVMQHFKEVLEQGEEGLMLKDPNAPYAFKRNKAWMKLKNADTYDSVVLRAIEGVGKYKGMLGALVVDYKGKEVHIGTGYSDQDRVDFWKVMPEVIEISFQEETPDGSLRHARFEKIRRDKT